MKNLIARLVEGYKNLAAEKRKGRSLCGLCMIRADASGAAISSRQESVRRNDTEVSQNCLPRFSKKELHGLEINSIKPVQELCLDTDSSGGQNVENHQDGPASEAVDIETSRSDQAVALPRPANTAISTRIFSARNSSEAVTTVSVPMKQEKSTDHGMVKGLLCLFCHKRYKRQVFFDKHKRKSDCAPKYARTKVGDSKDALPAASTLVNQEISGGSRTKTPVQTQTQISEQNSLKPQTWITSNCVEVVARSPSVSECSGNGLTSKSPNVAAQCDGHKCDDAYESNETLVKEGFALPKESLTDDAVDHMRPPSIEIVLQQSSSLDEGALDHQSDTKHALDSRISSGSPIVPYQDASELTRDSGTMEVDDKSSHSLPLITIRGWARPVELGGLLPQYDEFPWDPRDQAYIDLALNWHLEERRYPVFTWEDEGKSNVGVDTVLDISTGSIVCDQLDHEASHTIARQENCDKKSAENTSLESTVIDETATLNSTADRSSHPKSRRPSSTSPSLSLDKRAVDLDYARLPVSEFIPASPLVQKLESAAEHWYPHSDTHPKEELTPIATSTPTRPSSTSTQGQLIQTRVKRAASMIESQLAHRQGTIDPQRSTTLQSSLPDIPDTSDVLPSNPQVSRGSASRGVGHVRTEPRASTTDIRRSREAFHSRIPHESSDRTDTVLNIPNAMNAHHKGPSSDHRWARTLDKEWRDLEDERNHLSRLRASLLAERDSLKREREELKDSKWQWQRTKRSRR